MLQDEEIAFKDVTAYVWTYANWKYVTMFCLMTFLVNFKSCILLIAVLKSPEVLVVVYIVHIFNDTCLSVIKAIDNCTDSVE